MDDELTEDELQELLLELSNDAGRVGWDDDEYDFTPR